MKLKGEQYGIKWGSSSFTLSKLECSKQPFGALNRLAWDNRIGFLSIYLVFRFKIMVNRDSWGHLYSIVRGEILGFIEDKLQRKHLPSMFSLIKNES